LRAINITGALRSDANSGQRSSHARSVRPLVVATTIASSASARRPSKAAISASICATNAFRRRELWPCRMNAAYCGVVREEVPFAIMSNTARASCSGVNGSAPGCGGSLDRCSRATSTSRRQSVMRARSSQPPSPETRSS
jgi:hypothetical protein